MAQKDSNKRVEDETTEELKQLLVDEPATLSLLLKFLFPDPGEMPRFKSKQFKVSAQYPTPNGRIDLLLRTEGVTIILENKVDETPRVGQLRKYHDHWVSAYGEKPYIFWLLKRRADRLGRNDYLTREFLWNDFHTFFLSANLRLRSSKLSDFCHNLQSRGILLRPGQSAVIRKRSRGYDYDHAEQVLEQIAAAFPACEPKVEVPVNEVSHRLFIGRESWRSKFQDAFCSSCPADIPTCRIKPISN